jgi:hypothetical protein
MELPFKLFAYHKTNTRVKWRNRGVITENFEEDYNKYIYSTNCDICNKQYKTSKDRNIEHNHETGEIRGVVCTRCNSRKADKALGKNATTNYKGIRILTRRGYTTYVFSAKVNGKTASIKQNKNYEELVKFAEQWKKDNNYYT